MTILGVNDFASREKAIKFVNADDKTINRLARKSYNALYSESNKKFDKRINTTLNALPAVAVASNLAMGKGMKGSLLSGLSWGIALAAPTIVGKINKKAVEASPKLANTERKYPVATFMANVAASVGTFFGLTALANKVAGSKKVNKVFNNLKSKINPAAEKVTENVKEKGNEFIKKTKIKEAFNNAGKKVSGLFKNAKTKITPSAEKIAKNGTFKQVTDAVKKGGKFVVKNAPSIMVLTALGALVAKGVSDSKKMNNIKDGIKEAQMETAKVLVNDLNAESKELKSEKTNTEAEAEA